MDLERAEQDVVGFFVSKSVGIKGQSYDPRIEGGIARDAEDGFISAVLQSERRRRVVETMRALQGTEAMHVLLCAFGLGAMPADVAAVFAVTTADGEVIGTARNYLAVAHLTDAARRLHAAHGAKTDGAGWSHAENVERMLVKNVGSMRSSFVAIREQADALIKEALLAYIDADRKRSPASRVAAIALGVAA